MRNYSRYNARMRIVVVPVLWLAFVCAPGQVKETEPGWALKFTDFAATSNFHGRPATPILATRSQRMFRSAIRDAAAKGPNFAGHYTIAEWGCGSGCMSSAVVDTVTGKVYSAPFRILSMPLAQSEGGHEYQGAVYQLKSRLFIADGCPEETGCGPIITSGAATSSSGSALIPHRQKNDHAGPVARN